jgi:hypothetical protein
MKASLIRTNTIILFLIDSGEEKSCMTLVTGFPTDFLCGRWLLRSLHSHHHQLHSYLVSQVVTALIYKKKCQAARYDYIRGSKR